tara:strand:- start:379 stop:1134 length:756 start_codon:yes stop_codon:yes gene_type:complete
MEINNISDIIEVRENGDFFELYFINKYRSEFIENIENIPNICEEKDLNNKGKILVKNTNNSNTCIIEIRNTETYKPSDKSIIWARPNGDKSNYCGMIPNGEIAKFLNISGNTDLIFEAYNNFGHYSVVLDDVDLDNSPGIFTSFSYKMKYICVTYTGNTISCDKNGIPNRYWVYNKEHGVNSGNYWTINSYNEQNGHKVYHDCRELYGENNPNDPYNQYLNIPKNKYFVLVFEVYDFHKNKIYINELNVEN